MSFPSLQFNRMTGKWREASVLQSKMQVFRLAYLPRAPHTNAAPCPSSKPPVSNHNKSRKNIQHSHTPSIPLREKCPERRQVSHIHRLQLNPDAACVGNSTDSISELISWLRLLLALSSLLKMTATTHQEVQGTRLAMS